MDRLKGFSEYTNEANIEVECGLMLHVDIIVGTESTSPKNHRKTAFFLFDRPYWENHPKHSENLKVKSQPPTDEAYKDAYYYEPKREEVSQLTERWTQNDSNNAKQKNSLPDTLAIKNFFEVYEFIKTALGTPQNSKHQNKKILITLQGHASRSGNVHYNYALSKRRCKSIKELIENIYFYSRDNITFDIIPYGENQANQNNEREADRKVEIKITILEDSSIPVSDEKSSLLDSNEKNLLPVSVPPDPPMINLSNKGECWYIQEILNRMREKIGLRGYKKLNTNGQIDLQTRKAIEEVVEKMISPTVFKTIQPQLKENKLNKNIWGELNKKTWPRDQDHPYSKEPIYCNETTLLKKLLHFFEHGYSLSAANYPYKIQGQGLSSLYKKEKKGDKPKINSIAFLEALFVGAFQEDNRNERLKWDLTKHNHLMKLQDAYNCSPVTTLLKSNLGEEVPLDINKPPPPWTLLFEYYEDSNTGHTLLLLDSKKTKAGYKVLVLEASSKLRGPGFRGFWKLKTFMSLRKEKNKEWYDIEPKQKEELIWKDLLSRWDGMEGVTKKGSRGRKKDRKVKMVRLNVTRSTLENSSPNTNTIVQASSSPSASNTPKKPPMINLSNKDECWYIQEMLNRMRKKNRSLKRKKLNTDGKIGTNTKKAIEEAVSLLADSKKTQKVKFQLKENKLNRSIWDELNKEIWTKDKDHPYSKQPIYCNEKTLLNKLPHFKEYGFGMNSVNYPYEIKGQGLSGLNKKESKLINCITFIEAVFIGALQEDNEGNEYLKWDLIKHHHLMKLKDTYNCSPITVLLESNLGKEIKFNYNKPPPPWTFVFEYEENTDKGHTYIIVDSKETDTGYKLLILEASGAYTNPLEVKIPAGPQFENLGHLDAFIPIKLEWIQDEWHKLEGSPLWREQRLRWGGMPGVQPSEGYFKNRKIRMVQLNVTRDSGSSIMKLLEELEEMNKHLSIS